MKKLFLVLAVLVLLLVCLCPLTMAGNQDFTLINRTGVDIYALYVSPYNSNNWENEILGGRILGEGESINININGYSERYWDIMIEDKQGNSLYWRGINLITISKVILYYNGSRAWAEFE